LAASCSKSEACSGNILSSSKYFFKPTFAQLQASFRLDEYHQFQAVIADVEYPMGMSICRRIAQNIECLHDIVDIGEIPKIMQTPLLENLGF
jgi:hypothetical protein